MTCASDPCIELHNVTVVRGHRVVLNHVNLRARCGEFIVIIGANGAGKTTLLQVVNGTVQPASGQVSVLGKSPSFLNGYKLRRNVGFVAQAPHFDPRLPVTVLETVVSGCFGKRGLFRRIRPEDWQKARQALAWVGISHLADRPLGSISGGEFQRSAIARVLVQEPALLLFDEPTNSLDVRAKSEIVKLIERIHGETRATTLYVTHDLKYLPDRCDRILFIQKGEICGDGRPEELLPKIVVQEL
ncbi:MAG TPA: metal ABC transporter ATP-binding protein [Candidatus Hydrogenedentes bacterium]|nr:metal ABC transporter ATP-binding protein [Candidatus Hydrogenedentota bacterium]HPO86071.1 metal ABC transporter ATP-binding protein [Candidatus Hydrogenedentota bacterium]